MFYKKPLSYFLLIALLLVTNTPDGRCAPPAKAKAPLTPQQYYTQVKLDAAKAYQKSLDLKQQGKLTEAANALQKSVEFREYFIETDKELPVLKQQLGEAWLLAGDGERALRALSDAQKGYVTWYGPGCQQLIKPASLMGTIYSQRSDFTTAIKYFNQAFVIAQHVKGELSQECMDSRLQLAACYRAAKQLDQAEPIYEKCIEVQARKESLLSRDRLLAVLDDYAAVLKVLNKTDAATEILARAEKIRSTP